MTPQQRQAFLDRAATLFGWRPPSDIAVTLRCDDAPKKALVDWLASNPGNGESALDVACGLGDNAEALAGAGYRTTAFDLAPEAIDWAKKRFPDSTVDYQAADLFALPENWAGKFDLVHECYTLQALKDPMRHDAIGVLASLVAPGGRLLMITRSRDEGSDAKGPPWPMMPSEWLRFTEHGLTLVDEDYYNVERPDRTIPHVMALFRKPE